MEHNYDNDPNFCNNMNEFMNVSYKFPIINEIIKEMGIFSYGHRIKYTIDDDIDNYATDERLQIIQECFWQNKDRNVIKSDKFNVVVHIRRPNPHDNRIEGANTPDNYYLDIIQKIREQYKDRKPIFHIHSQGDISLFDRYIHEDTIINLNLDLRISFTEMVAADILILSASSFSYIAGYLCEGIVYYV